MELEYACVWSAAKLGYTYIFQSANQQGSVYQAIYLKCVDSNK